MYSRYRIQFLSVSSIAFAMHEYNFHRQLSQTRVYSTGSRARDSHVFHINRGILYTYVQKCPWVSSTHSFSAIRSQTQYLSHQNRSTFLLRSTPSTCDTTRMRSDVTYSHSAVFALHGQMPHPPRVTCQMPHPHSGFWSQMPHSRVRGRCQMPGVCPGGGGGGGDVEVSNWSVHNWSRTPW